MNGPPKTNLSDLYSDRKHAVVSNTVEDQTESIRSFDTSPFVISLSVITVLVVGLLLMAYAGYRVGASQNRIVAATTMASEVALQYDLASKNIDMGQYKMAVERLEFVVSPIFERECEHTNSNTFLDRFAKRVSGAHKSWKVVPFGFLSLFSVVGRSL